MSCLTNDEDLKDLKSLLVHFLNEKLQNKLDKMWDEGLLSDEKLAEMRKEHFRTT